MSVYEVRLANLRLLLDECGGNQSELARKLGSEPAYVNQLLRGWRGKNVGHRFARNAEQRMGKPPGWMDLTPPGDSSIAKSAAFDPVVSLPRRIPEILGATVLRLRDAAAALKDSEVVAYHFVQDDVGPRSFAYKVEGDAMESPTGGRSYPDGCIVVVDRDFLPVPRSRVLVSIDGSSEPVLRELVREGGRDYLKAYNPRFPMLERTPKTVVFGVVRKTILSE